MRLTLVLTRGRHIVPASDEDRAKLRAFKPGDTLQVKQSKARNYAHHAKFMALVTFVAEHHPLFRRFHNKEPLLHYLKDATGHYTSYVKPDGELVKIMGSISFDEMDEGDFIIWSAQAKQIMLDELLPGFTDRDKQRLEQEIEGWMAWN